MRNKQRFNRIACSDDPSRDPIDTGIKEIEADVRPTEEVVSYQFCGNSLKRIVQDDS